MQAYAPASFFMLFPSLGLLPTMGLASLDEESKKYPAKRIAADSRKMVLLARREQQLNIMLTPINPLVDV